MWIHSDYFERKIKICFVVAFQYTDFVSDDNVIKVFLYKYLGNLNAAVAAGDAHGGCIVGSGSRCMAGTVPGRDGAHDPPAPGTALPARPARPW